MPVITDASDLSLPLDAFQMTVEEDLMLQRAVWVLTVECMAGFGVRYSPPSELFPSARVTHERRYGLLDRESAQAWGYHGEDPAVERGAQEAEQAADQAGQMSEAVEELLMGPSDPLADPAPGVPEDGCVGQAHRTLTQGEESYDENAVLGLALQSNTLAEQDERVRAAFAQWAECMTAAGFDYASPWDANNDQWMSEVVTDLERAVASADVICKHQTNLVGVWSAVDAAYQERLIEAHAERLTALREARTRVLARAADIVAGSGDA